MLSPTPKQLQKLEKLAKVLDNGDIALLTELNALEDRLEGIEGQLPALREAEDGYTPKKGVDYEDGKDYVLTENDKKEIAKSIQVPVVDRVIERTEVIREVPLVTNKITNQIVKEIVEREVEVAVLDQATVAYLEDEIKRVEDKIPEIVKQKETNFGFVIRDVVAGTNVIIDKTDPNRPIVSATGGSGSQTLQETTTLGNTTTDDIEITDTTKGVIIKSANGTRFRIGITDDGELTTTSL